MAPVPLLRRLHPNRLFSSIDRQGRYAVMPTSRTHRQCVDMRLSWRLIACCQRGLGTLPVSGRGDRPAAQDELMARHADA